MFKSNFAVSRDDCLGSCHHSRACCHATFRTNDVGIVPHLKTLFSVNLNLATPCEDLFSRDGMTLFVLRFRYFFIEMFCVFSCVFSRSSKKCMSIAKFQYGNFSMC